MSFERAIILLKEFYYERNGKEATIDFLKFIVKKLEESSE